MIQEQEQARRRDASPILLKFAFLQKRKVGLVLLTRQTACLNAGRPGFSLQRLINWMRWVMPVILVLRRWREEDQ